MYYYSHNIGDFDKKTRHLNRIERSVYLDMIHLYYTDEKQLMLDVAKLCRKILANDEQEKAAVLTVLEEFFVQTPDGWYHDRCEEELAAYRKSQSQASAAGKASAAAKKERKQQAINGHSTVVEVSFNDRSTDEQRTVNEQSTTRQLNSKHEPVTSNQETEAEKQEPLKSNPVAPAVAVAAEKKVRKEVKAAPGTGKVWVAYATAYWNRYGVEPVRNAMVNGQLSSLVKRIGLDDAEQVAGFFVGHQHRYYVEKMHSVGLLLADCEKLRTEWATSTQMTQAKASQADKTATNLDAFAPLIAAAKAREEAERNRNGQ